MSGDLKGKKILIVDDETDLREIICEDLQFLGAEVFQAENGRVAYEICERECPDALVSDVRMPGGDGLELIRRLRSRGGRQPDVFLITGFSDLTNDEANGLGVQGMLLKPFNLKQLRALLVGSLTSKSS